MNKVCVVGLGYIGLPTACLIASSGLQVHGVDISSHIVGGLNKGQVHIFEPDLDKLLKRVVTAGTFVASEEPTQADVFLIAVPTPFRANHVPDVSYVEAAVSSIAPHLGPGNLVIIESTIPVGTTERAARILGELRPDLAVSARSGRPKQGVSGQVFVAHCPERVLPGQILKELVNNDRIIGGVDEDAAHLAKALYARFVTGTILTTDSRTAELCKLVENSYRDVNIAFANELSLICDDLQIDVWELIQLANRHPRVNILQPGPGVGGHCIAVDPWFVVDAAPERARLIRTAREINDSKPAYVVGKVQEAASRFKHPVIALLGLAYKPDIDDLRESPAAQIAHELVQSNCGRVIVVEPYVKSLPASLQSVEQIDLESALRVADIVVLLVNHKTFLNVDRALLQEKVVIDTRGVWR